jgi:hypothetical protein
MIRVDDLLRQHSTISKNLNEINQSIELNIYPKLQRSSNIRWSKVEIIEESNNVYAAYYSLFQLHSFKHFNLSLMNVKATPNSSLTQNNQHNCCSWKSMPYSSSSSITKQKSAKQQAVNGIWSLDLFHSSNSLDISVFPFVEKKSSIKPPKIGLILGSNEEDSLCTFPSAKFNWFHLQKKNYLFIF